ncbi:MAG: chromate transporter [Alphaproteobacteria bacterium 65-7]|nr:MAG: chromate transporter [Alphaproteobacteria bacterium 65-7]
MKAVLETFLIFLRLGVTSFGGPVAHIAYFREAFVVRRRWLNEEAYGALVGFCQFLPGPSSSQVAMGLGLQRAGYGGLLAAFAGFTLPSAALMILFALLLDAGVARAPWTHGLKLAAAAIVAQALWSMARTLTPDAPRLAMAALAAALALLAPGAVGQIAAIALGAGLGALIVRPAAGAPEEALRAPRHLARAPWLLAAFCLLLAGLPLLAARYPGLALFDIFYRTGALVFGGGHVVLPLLQQALVTPGWIDAAPFLAGYGAAQAVPGPLFSFAAFLGAKIGGMGTALLCLLAIYLPSLLLVAGGWPLWRRVAHHAALRAALAGINAAVVGLLAAALWSPVLTEAIRSVSDMAIAGTALLLLWRARAPSWAVVGFCALMAAILAAWLR